jgi:phosphate starvation-inducible PhoH-like protein
VTKRKLRRPGDRTVNLAFEDNLHLRELVGGADRHLHRIEEALDVFITLKGNRFTIQGGADGAHLAEDVLRDLHARLSRGLEVGTDEVDAAIRIALGSQEGRAARISLADVRHQLRAGRRVITPRSARQADYLHAMANHDLVFGLGPAGTGKTYLAVAYAVSELLAGRVERVVLSRPAVEAGERLGFLPGDLKEKLDPYLQPLYDALRDTLGAEQMERRLASQDVEIAPLAFMRGRTLSRAFVILDEAQNATSMQMKMFLTRLGDGGRMVVTGDPSQIDLPQGMVSGLVEARSILGDVAGVSFVEFTPEDVVRHALVTRIVEAYDKKDKSSGAAATRGKGRGNATRPRSAGKDRS